MMMLWTSNAVSVAMWSTCVHAIEGNSNDLTSPPSSFTAGCSATWERLPRRPMDRGKHCGFGAEAQVVVRAQQGLEHPPAEEAGTAGDEQSRAAQLIPQPLGVLEHVVQVAGRQRLRANPRHRYGCSQLTRPAPAAAARARRASAAGHSSRRAGSAAPRWPATRRRHPDGPGSSHTRDIEATARRGHRP